MRRIAMIGMLWCVGCGVAPRLAISDSAALPSDSEPQGDDLGLAAADSIADLAAIDGAQADTGIDGPILEPGQVRCGASNCNGGSEICLACTHQTTGNRDLHCAPHGGDFFNTSFQEAQARGCDYFLSLFIACDSADDCAVGEVCQFTGGEAGYAYCREANTSSWGTACESASDCLADAPTCASLDPFGYFSPFAPLLGWLPRACQP